MFNKEELDKTLKLAIKVNKPNIFKRLFYVILEWKV